jgi:preprotein translocase subunit YajC
MSTLILFGGMFLLLWLFLLGPERRKRKQHEQRLAQLKEKDEVMTLGGIFGTVVMLRGDQITIRVDEKRGTTLRIARSSVATILPRESGAKEKDKESDAEAE